MVIDVFKLPCLNNMIYFVLILLICCLASLESIPSFKRILASFGDECS